MVGISNKLQITSSVVEGSEPEILNEILSPDCAVAIWQRRPSTWFQNWIDVLPPQNLPNMRVNLSPETVKGTLKISFDSIGMPGGVGRRMLEGDIAALATMFARVMEVDMVQIRLDVVTGNACRKFHLDNVKARMLCTYRGRGTQFGVFQPDNDPNPIEELPVGYVGFFRGRMWTKADYSYIVHRSPPIDGTGETRLLLVIDTA